ncbi:F0F1 ATP synthase subunit epsilon [Kribbella sandramycini]|uniref:ATP synthase epsilon chain n=1 Tax=Kribbella sandramycini TaxID=60450 RepID=A0A7Y4P3D3_9ACTN|nr:F0F1 ATP synthase subunit epsilon [Kribbella sandramycini]MBB6570854.1 F-type H+-transporting ATPase subunit epsilon [Kribbella sandramycini]NOL43985.1 F0F1 ATP synthase subunit epsilon [Kribbella sandramycini]
MADESGKHLEVALVAAERVVWEGQATIVIARTTDGDVGILPGHAPLLGLLQGGTVQVRTVDGDFLVAAAPDGFISVANDRVSILAENAEMGHDIDLEEARRELELALKTGTASEADADEVRLAEARVRAAETAS